MSFFVDDNITAPTKEHGAFLQLIQSGKIGVRDLRYIANDREFDNTTRLMACREILKSFEMLPMDMERELAQIIVHSNDELAYLEFAKAIQSVENPNDLPY